MFVLTADQNASRRTGDQVEQILEHLAQISAPLGEAVVLEFERTVGDEVQGVVGTASAALTIAMELQRAQQWAVGIGVGPVERLTTNSRSSTGPAFLHARTAVERARGKGVTVPLTVQAGPPAESHAPAEEVEALVQLLAAVVRRRSDAGWEVADLLAAGTRTHRQVAAELGITPQAVGQRARTAMWSEQAAVTPLAVRLLAELDAAGHSGDHG